LLALKQPLENVGYLARLFAIVPVQHAVSELIYPASEAPPDGITTAYIEVALKRMHDDQSGQRRGEDSTEDGHTTINVNANKRHGPPAAAKKTIGSELAHNCDVFFLSSLVLRLSAKRVSCAEKANNCSERSLGER